MFLGNPRFRCKSVDVDADKLAEEFDKSLHLGPRSDLVLESEAAEQLFGHNHPTTVFAAHNAEVYEDSALHDLRSRMWCEITARLLTRVCFSPSLDHLMNATTSSLPARKM